MELFFALAGGIAMALVFQLLLTSLGVALGLSMLSFSPTQTDHEPPVSAAEQETDAGLGRSPSDPRSRPSATAITHLLGLGVTFGLSGVLFGAAWLAAVFSQFLDPWRGLSFGVIFWATYWLLFVWVSTTTTLSALDAVLGGLFSGGRQLIKTLRNALKSSNEPAEPSPTLAADLVQEVTQAVVESTSTAAELRTSLPQLLAQQREQLVADICDRTDFSEKDAGQILETLSKASQQPHPAPDAQAMKRQASHSDESSNGQVDDSGQSPLSLPDWKQLLQTAISQTNWRGLAFGALEEPVAELLQSQREAISQKSVHIAAAAFLRYAPEWSLQPESLPGALVDWMADADVELTEAPLFSREQITSWLAARKSLEPQTVEAIAAQLSEWQPNWQSHSDTHHMQEPANKAERAAQLKALKAVENKLIAYCRYTNVDLLTPESVTAKVIDQLENHRLTLSSELRLDTAPLEQVLSRRRNLPDDKRQTLISALEAANPKHQPTSIAVQEKLSVEMTENRGGSDISDSITRQLTHYLRHQRKSAFQPARMAEDLLQVISHGLMRQAKYLSQADPSAALSKTLSSLQSLWAPDLWARVLTERKDMTVEEIQQILDWGKSAWQNATEQLSSWVEALPEALPEASLEPVASLLHPEGEWLGDVRQQVVEYVSAAQEKIEAEAIALKTSLQTDLQRQAETARAQAAIAAWWLSSALLCSGIAAGGAGWLAIK